MPQVLSGLEGTKGVWPQIKGWRLGRAVGGQMEAGPPSRGLCLALSRYFLLSRPPSLYLHSKGSKYSSDPLPTRGPGCGVTEAML